MSAKITLQETQIKVVYKALEVLHNLHYCQFIHNGKEYDKHQEAMEIQTYLTMAMLSAQVEDLDALVAEANELSSRFDYYKLYKYDLYHDGWYTLTNRVQLLEDTLRKHGIAVP